MQLNLYEFRFALLYGFPVFLRNCSNLAGEDICIVLNSEVAKKTASKLPTYTLPEVIELLRSPPDDLLKLHKVKSTMNAYVEGGLSTDPRLDLKEDSALWTELLSMAEEDVDLAEALFATRWGGAKLEAGKDTYLIRPGTWPSKEEYEDVRDLWLIQHKDKVAELLRRLWRRTSSKAS